VLEDANIKLPSVASNALGKSDRAILQTIIKEEQSAERLADPTQRHCRQDSSHRSRDCVGGHLTRLTTRTQLIISHAGSGVKYRHMLAKGSGLSFGQKVMDAIPEDLREGIIVQFGISQDPPAILKNGAAANANNNSGRGRQISEPRRAGLRYAGSCPG
jgi:hypothetical protein